MKKYLLVLVCAVLLFVTGCGNKNQVKCSQSITESGITMKAEVVADLDKDNKITDVSVVYDLGDKSTADSFCSLMKLSIDSSKGQSIDCSGSKITLKGLDSLDNEEEDSEKVIGQTKDDFVKKATEEGFTCK